MGIRMNPKGTPRVWASWLFDLTMVVVILSIRWDATVRADPGLDATSSLPTWWWGWGNLQDWLLIGPDAGNWAANAEAWRDGSALDSHRLPIYSMLTAWFSSFFGDVVFAGHQVNHLLSALLGLLAYAIGRITSGRAVAVAAGVLTAWSPELVNNQLLFGVDPSLQFAVLLLALGTLLALSKGTWPWVVGAGFCLSWAMATHYLLMLFVPVSAFCFLLMKRPLSLRIRYMVAFLLIGWLGFQFFARDYEDLSVGMVLNVFTEGVAGSDGRVIAEGPMGGDTATSIVVQNLPTAPRLAVQRGLRSMKVEGVPWTLLLMLFWVGLLGWGLQNRERKSIDWRHTLFFLAFLSPLIGLEASRAPDRYALFSRPIFFLVVARGVVSLTYMAEWGFRKGLPPWRKLPQGLLRGCLSAVVVLGLLSAYRAPYTQRWELRPPVDEGLGDRAIAAAINEEFTRQGGIVTTSQALEYFTGRTRCPGNFCPRGGNDAVAQCFEEILRQCSGGGHIPYVVSRSRTAGLGDQRNEAVDQVIAANFERVATHRGEALTLDLYRVERRELLDLARSLRSRP
ncbi:MAG: glycosyltransferase family 39 protein [Myxococcota bacterium]|nr:glycosyltransferase family 39 protein [Myxococcota bacterium]